MNALRHDQTAMTPAEAEAIVARVMDRADPMARGPSVADVAETLGISPDEVARLLAEHRARPAKRRRPSNRRERRVWMLSGVAALAIAGVALGLMRGFQVGPWASSAELTTVTVAAPEAVGSPAVDTATIPAAGVVPSADVVSPDRVFRVFMDEQDTGASFQVDLQGDDAQALPSALEGWMRVNPNRVRKGWASRWDASQGASREAARAGRWADVSGVRMATIELRRPDRAGRIMRWASTTAPIYEGDDALIADAVAAERRRRVQKAVDAARKGLSGEPQAAGATTGSTTG